MSLPHALSIPDPYMRFGQTQTYVIKNTSLAHMEKPRQATHLYVGRSASQSLLNHFQMTSEQMVVLFMKHYNSQGRILRNAKINYVVLKSKNQGFECVY